MIDMTRRDPRSRYASSAASSAWLLHYPAAVSVNFILSFSMLRNRQAGAAQVVNPVLFINCGFSPLQSWSESLSRSAVAIVAVLQLVRNIVLPSEVNASKALGGCLQPCINLAFIAFVATLGFGITTHFGVMTASFVNGLREVEDGFAMKFARFNGGSDPENEDFTPLAAHLHSLIEPRLSQILIDEIVYPYRDRTHLLAVVSI